MPHTNGSNGSHEDRKLVVVQQSGGNDYLNSVVPYTNGHYYDFRAHTHHDPEDVLKIDDTVGFGPTMGPIKELWDQGKVAVINGVGYPNPDRSHFRSMDIWHTAEPEELSQEGWLGRAVRDMDLKGENVLTAVNFGVGLPRALGCDGVPVASVGDLATYGLFPDIKDEWLREYALEAFGKMYGAAAGKEAVMGFLGQTGTDALKGADILSTAPERYSSTIEYGSNGIAKSLKDAAQVMFAGFGTRIFYATHGSYDNHAGLKTAHPQLWTELGPAVTDFMDDLEEHGEADDTAMLVFSEFGRRVRDNGNGADHGSGGVAFLIGNKVKGGMYGEYPSLAEKDHLDGDLHFNNDFRGIYTAIAEDWLGLDAAPIVKGRFESFNLFED